MSVQTEITRISNAKSAIKTAIGNKGVTVPSTTKLDGMATLIGQISTGTDTSDATATSSDILSGKTAYVDGSKITGTIPTKTESNISASGKTVTVPAGYYASQVTKSVATGSATAPSSISGSSATVSTGTNTLTLSKTVSVTPSVSAGYVSSGTAGNSSVSLTASVTTKAAATITPTTSNQTIAAGTYLTGAQTISGSSSLVAGNIKKGVSIFGVSGSYEGESKAAVVYPGTNLFSLNDVTKTINNVTWVTHSNGIMEASGLSNGSTWFNSYKKISLSAGTYTFIAFGLTPSTSIRVKYTSGMGIGNISDLPESGVTDLWIKYGSVHCKTFTLTEDTTNYFFSWRNSDQHPNSGKAQLMLFSGYFPSWVMPQYT